MKVYLAGPITGLTYKGCNDWRDYIRDKVPGFIRTLNTLRGKQYLEQRSNADGAIQMSYEEYPLSSARGINTRDHWDVMRCDVVLVNLLGAKSVSIGTVMEIAWAFAYKKPVILIMEDEGNPHEHAMIKESIDFRVNSLEKGLEVLIALCGTDQDLKPKEYEFYKSAWD